ncbi:S8 family serine peptidase [Pseudoxanthomonas winnipegensis]|uniref:S8 family serine peptidase n=1 Tax=Pseudoxanthomonas winnipegensis TaxID=2480810 RepID=UPI002577F2C4|nr:S8 family serine peptidase [Pseudoxanthomonas winnipegensis]WJI16114.1 S8 family serine peptidase [Pseudoxanthomonas winnipegensis]
MKFGALTCGSAARRRVRPALPWLLLAAGAALASAVLANPVFRHQLDSREAWMVNAQPAVGVAVAATPGRSGDVERLVRQLGGRVDYAHRPTDFVTAVLPSSQVTRFLANAPLVSFAVEKRVIRGTNPPDGWDPKPASDGAVSPVRNIREGWPPREGMAPVEHPYDVRKDMDADTFLMRHAGNDGRGVVVAHVEYFPDFLSPELQTALAANGGTLPKFRDVINIPGLQPSLDPAAPRKGWFWSHRLSATMAARDGAIAIAGSRHRVPAAGDYRMALLDLDKEIGALWAVWPVLDKAFHGRRYPEGLKPENANTYLRTRVLWSPARRMLWIDTDQDGDFDDETGVEEYARSRQIGVLGQDDPATRIRETVGYTVQIDGDYVSVNMGFGSHVTAVAGALAASRGREGRIEGVAPGVQLVAINANEDVSGFSRAMIAAYEHPAVDVVLIEGHAAITSLHEIGVDGGSLIAVVLGRLQALHDKPTLFTAFNTPGMSTISDATVPDNVLSIGAYQSADAVYANYGIHVRYQDDLHWAGSEGPAGNGGLKPDFLSPANPTSLEPGNVDRDDGGKRPGVFRMIGYGICSGTSCATPVAAGGAAMLVGAAKREGLRVSGSVLHRALRDAARPLPRLPVYKQGRGLIQVDAAWQRLQRIAHETPEAIEVSAPVKTLMSPWLQRPGTGQGLFEREGWRPGQRAARTITLTRTSGPATPVRYRLRWTGDEAAFRSPSQVVLPLGRPVSLVVEVDAAQARVYSALLELHREGLAGPAAVIPATIVVPHRFTAQNRYQVEQTFELDRPGRVNLFYDVPEGAGLVRLEVSDGRKEIRSFMHAPNNWQAASTFTVEDGGQDLATPMAGSWQMTLMDMGDGFAQDWSVAPGTVLPRTKIGVRASLLSVEARMAGGEVVLRNTGAPFEGYLRSHALAVQRSETIALSAVQDVERTLTVAEGTERLVLELTPEAGTDSAWINLYACTAEGCTRQGEADLSGDNKRIVVDRPKAGTWKWVLTHASDKPGRVVLRETHSHPDFGALASADAPRMREVAAQWRVPVNLWRRNAVPAGYVPAVLLDVQASGFAKQPPASVLICVVAQNAAVMAAR